MNPPAHRPLTAAQQEQFRLRAIEFQLFFDNIDLILQHEQNILVYDEYFYCQPSFAHYGVYGGAHINLGTLLLGWRDGIFLDACRANIGTKKNPQECSGLSLVYCFGGLLSGTGWAGYCVVCSNSKFFWDGTLTMQRMDFASSANKQFRDTLKEAEEYDGFNFSFAEPAIVPATKTRTVVRSLHNAVSVAELIDELQTGNIRKSCK